MKRINDILNDPDYLNCVEMIRAAETDRIYCCHDPTHFLDVARIARILALEERIDADKELLYAMGLFHDIGRQTEYENGTDHAIAGSELAEKILAKHGFTKAERTTIAEAIEGHRAESAASPMAALLYRADKLSRNCVLCDAIATCKRFQNGEKAVLLY